MLARKSGRLQTERARSRPECVRAFSLLRSCRHLHCPKRVRNKEPPQHIQDLGFASEVKNGPAFDSASALGSLKYEVSGFWRMVSLDMLWRGCRKIRNMQVPRVLATLHVPFHLDDNNQRQMFAGVLKPSGFCATGREGPVAKPDTAT